MTNTVPNYIKEKKKPKAYSSEIKDQAIDLFHEALPEHKTRVGAAKHVVSLLGVGCYDTVLKWVKQSDIDAGKRPGMTTEENAELRKLRRENAELRRANGILKAASAFFAAELDRPQL